MKISLPFIITTFIVFLCFNGLAQETIELEEKPGDMFFHLDSIGNIISHKRALELMRTGEYISIPSLNSFFEIEHLIRKRDPSSPVDNQYQVHTDGSTVISTKNFPFFKPKLKMGDTITSLCAKNAFSNKICIGKEKSNPNSILVIVDDITWIKIRGDLMNLIEQYLDIDFLLVPTNEDKSLDHFFTKSFLKKYQNIYLVDNIQKELISNSELFPIYYMVDHTGKVKLMIPPIPKPEIALRAIQSYINSLN